MPVVSLVRCISRSLSRLDAPNRNQSGSSQSGADGLVDHDQVLDRVLGGPDAAGRLHADLPPGGGAEVADRLQHHQGHRQRRRDRDLAGGGLDEVAAGQHGQPGGPPHVVVGGQLAGLQDHLEVGVPAGLLGRPRSRRRPRLYRPARNAPRLITMSISSAPAATAARVSASLTSSGAWPDGNAVATLARCTPTAAQHLGHVRDHRRVDADRADVRAGRVGRVRAQRLGGQRPHLARGVRPLQRGQVDHPDRQVDRLGLGGGLDGAGAELCRPLLRADLVHAGQAVQEGPQSGLGSSQLGELRPGRRRCRRHAGSLRTGPPSDLGHGRAVTRRGERRRWSARTRTAGPAGPVG